MGLSHYIMKSGPKELKKNVGQPSDSGDIIWVSVIKFENMNLGRINVKIPKFQANESWSLCKIEYVAFLMSYA